MSDEELSEAFVYANIYLATYIASITTALFVLFAFQHDIYFGSPYAIAYPSDALVKLMFLIIPAALWSLICLWPLVLSVSGFCIRMIKRYPIFIKYHAWALSGAILGIPAMFFYAFFLDLGFTKWIELSATGAICGIFCSSLSWSLIRLQIYKRAIGIDTK